MNLDTNRRWCFAAIFLIACSNFPGCKREPPVAVPPPSKGTVGVVDRPALNFSFPMTHVVVFRDHGAIVSIAVNEEQITGADVNKFAEIESLRDLKLWFCRLDNEALLALPKLTQITGLYLSQASVADKDMSAFIGMKKLEALSLAFTELTDGGIDALIECKQLTALDVSFTHITQQGLVKLKKGLPECLIYSTGIPE